MSPGLPGSAAVPFGPVAPCSDLCLGICLTAVTTGYQRRKMRKFYLSTFCCDSSSVYVFHVALVIHLSASQHANDS